MTIAIYPVLALWVWHPSGFLYVLGFIDFAGGGVVHTAGACVRACVRALFCCLCA
jgi:ammonia channel protein AmtB